MQFAIDLLRNGKGVLLAGLLVALLTGCGGGSDNGDTGNPNPPPAAPPDDGDDDDDDDDDGDDGNDDDGDDGGDNTGATFSNFQAASLVIGQQDFSGGDPDQGGTAPGANTLGLPAGGVDYADAEDVFFVNDSANARTLGFLGIPDTNNANADFVLGQPDFVQSSPKVAEPGGMISPEAVSIGNGNLMITDTDRNRVAVYDGVPTAGGAAPVLAIGQSGVATNPPEGGCNATTLVHPHDHFVAEDGKVLVADAGNNRVLVWNAMPAESGAPADFALGQIDLANCSAADPRNFQHPSAIWSDGERVIVADTEKHRVLIWNTFPTTGFQAPDVILGQSAIDNIMPNDDDQDGATDDSGEATARTLYFPRDIEVVDGKLYVADMDNHRVLIWNSIPTESFAEADVVLGQENFTANAPNAGQAEPNEQGFQRPIGLTLVGTQLFVTDWENSRVLAFDGETAE